MASVSVIVPTYDRIHLLRDCLAAAQAAPGLTDVQWVVADDASSDGTAAWLASRPDLTAVVRPENGGFARACASGAAAADGDVLVFLNNDTLAEPGWLAELVAPLDEVRDAGIVGANLAFPDGTVQHTGVVVVGTPQQRVLPYHFRYQEPGHRFLRGTRRMQVVTGAVFALPRALFHDLDGFDPGFRNGYEDVDLCFRAGREGAEVLLAGESRLVHLESKSGPQRFAYAQQNERLLAERWDGVVEPDLVVEGSSTRRASATFGSVVRPGVSTDPATAVATAAGRLGGVDLGGWSLCDEDVTTPPRPAPATIDRREGDEVVRGLDDAAERAVVAERGDLGRGASALLMTMQLPSSDRVLVVGNDLLDLAHHASDDRHVDLVVHDTVVAEHAARRLEGRRVQVVVATPADLAALDTYPLVVGRATDEDQLAGLRARVDHDGVLVALVANATPFHGQPAVDGVPVRELGRAPAGRAQLTLAALLDGRGQRIVFAPSMQDAPDEVRALLVGVPTWGSMDNRTDLPSGMWARHLRNRHEATYADAHVVIEAADDAAIADLWPQDRLLSWANTGRRAAFCTTTHVRADERGHVVEQRPVLGDQVRRDGLVLVPTTSRVHDASTVRDQLAVATSFTERRRLLRAWRDALVELSWPHDGPIDAIPSNLLVAADGSHHWIDLEWWLAGCTRADVLGRGALATAITVLPHTRGWDTAPQHVAGVVTELAHHLDLEGTRWLGEAIELEGRLQAMVVGTSQPAGVAARVREDHVAALQGSIPGAPALASAPAA